MNEAIREMFLTEWVKEATTNEIVEKLIEHDDRGKEIERLNNIIKGLDNTIENLNEVLQQKENIIKDVREYLEIFTSFDECTINGRMVQKAIDILDKEDKDDNI